MAEPEAVLDRLVRPDQLPAHERGQPRSGGPALVGSKLAERLPLELETDDGGALEQSPLLFRQRVQARREQGPDGRAAGPPYSPPSFVHRQHLLDEERVALGRVAYARPRGSLEPGAVEQALDQLVGLALTQRLERQHLCRLPASSPCGAGIKEVEAGEADEQDRRLPRPVEKVLDQVEEGRLGPVDVLDDQDERSLAARCSRNLRTPQKVLFGRASRLTIAAASSLLGVGGAKDLDERPVRDPFAVGQAPPGEYERFGRAGWRRARATSRDLPIPGGPRTVTSRQRRSRDSVVEGSPEARQLITAADERRVEPALESGCGRLRRRGGEGRRRARPSP